MAGRLPHWLFRGLLGVHCTLQPARPADSLTEPFLGVLQPIRHLLDRPKCFRLGRTSPVGSCTRGFNVPLQGTHNNVSERTLRHQAIGRKNSYDLPSTLSAYGFRDWLPEPSGETCRRWRRAAPPTCIDGRSNSYSGIGYPRMKVRRAGWPRSGCCGRNTEFLTRVPFTAPATRALRQPYDKTMGSAPQRARYEAGRTGRSTI